MSLERYQQLVQQLCEVVDLPDVAGVLSRGSLEVSGFSVLLGHYENDLGALYLSFNFGIVSAGRSLHLFKLMLEANLTVYAQDQAQMGLDPETGSVLLIVRVPMADDIDGAWLAETFDHYAEHGRYWRDSMINAPDDAFEGLCSGEYTWMKV